MSMDYDQIIALLDNYFEGKTTRKDELFIQNFYLENKDLPPSLEKYRPLFLYFNQAKKEAFPKKIKKKISNTYFAVAASLLFLIGLFIAQSTYNIDNNDNVDESAMLEAYDDFKTNITYLSKNLQKGTSSMHYLTYWDETTNELLNK